MHARVWTFLCAGLAALLFATVWIVGGQRPAAGATPYQVAPQVDPFVVDHRWLPYFDTLNSEEIAAASRVTLFHMHSWLGNGISQGLDCMNRLPPAPRGYCSGSSPMDAQYNRRLWDFIPYSEGSDPAWYGKADSFASHVDAMAPGEYDAVSFEFNYSDSGAPQFFDERPSTPMPNVFDLETEMAQHPEKTLVYWTMALGTELIEPNAYNGHIYNSMLRDYTSANSRVLFDVAQILSHREDGTPCVDSATGIVLMCAEYSDGPQGGGSLNVAGRERMAKAMWLLTAHLAGWTPDDPAVLTPTVPPGSPPPTATPTLTPTATRTARPTDGATVIPTPRPGGPTPTPRSGPATATPIGGGWKVFAPLIQR